MNTDLARRALKEIENNPHMWEQQSWRCGSAMCFAGHVAMEAGAVWAEPSGDRSQESLFVITPGGERTWVAEYATEALEVSPFEAHNLFAPANTIEDLDALIRSYEEGHVAEGRE